MRHILSICLCTAVLALTACGTRDSIPQSEREVTATIAHTMTRKESYDRIEVSLVSIFNSPRDVTQVKQPENGRIIIKALTGPLVLQKDPFGPDVTMTLPFTMDVQTSDNKTTVAYEITGPGDPDFRASRSGWTRGYPNDMRPVLLQFHASIAKLARDLGGTVIEHSPLPPEPTKPDPSTVKAEGKGARK